MSDSANWRTDVDSTDYFQRQKKALAVADRRPVIRRASDLVGPGIAATAIKITDFNDQLATYNGYYSALAGASNAPNGDEAFVGMTVMDDFLGGRQVYTGLSSDTEYTRLFLRNPGDPSSITWGDWVESGSGGGGGVPTSRLVATDSTLTGGGDLSADRTLGVDLTAEAERIRDVIGTALVEGTGIDITVDDGLDTITIANTGVLTSRTISTDSTLTGGGDLSSNRTLGVDTTAEAERVRDVIGTALVQGTNVTITVNDPGDTITIAASSSGGSTRDRRWLKATAETTIDEFNDDSLDAAWGRVDASGGSGRVVWTEEADVLSLRHNGSDGSNELHGMMRLLSSIGGAPATGDAFITAFRQMLSPSTNYSMAGIILANGNTYGSGTQIVGFSYAGSSGGQTTDTRSYTGYNTNTGTSSSNIITHQGILTYLRLVYLGSNNWRTDVSPDGITWFNGPANLSLTLTPTYVGLFASSFGSGTKHLNSYEFLRRVSGVS